MNEYICEVFQKYSKYVYINDDIVDPNYHIKSQKEFDDLNGGICWDFCTPILTQDRDYINKHIFIGE